MHANFQPIQISVYSYKKQSATLSTTAAGSLTFLPPRKTLQDMHASRERLGRCLRQVLEAAPHGPANTRHELQYTSHPCCGRRSFRQRPRPARKAPPLPASAAAAVGATVQRRPLAARRQAPARQLPLPRLPRASQPPCARLPPAGLRARVPQARQRPPPHQASAAAAAAAAAAALPLLPLSHPRQWETPPPPVVPPAQTGWRRR